jgi:hypothetical protein
MMVKVERRIKEELIINEIEEDYNYINKKVIN